MEVYMQLCKPCREKLQMSPSARLCAECRLLAWPGVRTLLIGRAVERLYIDCTLQKDLLDWVEQGSCIQAAWRAYLTALSSVARPPAGATLAVQVRTMLAVWKAAHIGVQRYSILSQGVEPLV